MTRTWTLPSWRSVLLWLLAIFAALAVVCTTPAQALATAPVAVPDAYETPEDEGLYVYPPGVLANDVDPDGDILTAAQLLASTSHGTLTFNAFGAGGFIYFPDADYNGTDTFRYRCASAAGGAAYSGSATVTITVTPVNDAPVAPDDGALPSQVAKLPAGRGGGLGSGSATRWRSQATPWWSARI